MPDDIPRAEVSALPVEFGAHAALLDVREDDEWHPRPCTRRAAHPDG